MGGASFFLLRYRTNNVTLNSFFVDVKNQLTNAPGGNRTYDGNGNLVESHATGPDLFYTYDDENRLTTVEREEVWRSEFTYDGLGRLRVREEYDFNEGWNVSSETHYLYDGWRVIQERNGSNNVPTVSYTRGTDLSGSLEGAGGIGGLLARSHGYSSGNWTNHNCYHADGNGNVTYLVTASQAQAARYRYDPYGTAISVFENLGFLGTSNTYRFSSKMVDVRSGHYYYGYRFYEPNFQRWVNVDPLGEAGFETIRDRRGSPMVGEPNLHLFVSGNPITKVDFLGMCTIELWCWPAFQGTAGNNVHCEYNISGAAGGNGRCRGEQKPCSGILRKCWCDFMCLGSTWKPSPPPMPTGAYMASSVTAPESACDCLRNSCQNYPATSCYVLATLGAAGHGTSNTAASCLNDRCSMGFAAPNNAPGWGHSSGCPW